MNLNSVEEPITRCIQRVATMWCSDTQSATFGCADREFWSYRTTRGFASGPFQHMMAGLAYFSSLEGSLNTIDHRNTALSMLDFWISARNLNGSANEWYRNEQSFCATAFGLHAACETLILLRDKMSSQQLEAFCIELSRSEQWLRERDNPLAANQQVASCTGRYVLGTLLDDQTISDWAERDLQKVRSDLEKTGFLAEYGGPDVGYTLLSMDLLVAAHQAGLSVTEPLATEVCRCLSTLMSESKYLPFELGSRATRHQFFGGIAYFSQFLPAAEEFLQRSNWYSPIVQGDALFGYDDRYFATFGFTAFARRVIFSRTELATGQTTEPRLIASRSEITSEKCGDGTLFIHTGFGCSLSWIKDATVSATHLGYVFRDAKGRRWTSLAPTDGKKQWIRFVKATDSSPLVKWETLVRFIFVLCRYSAFARVVSWLARTKVGRSRRKSTIAFSREISYDQEKLKVKDRIRFGPGTSGQISIVSEFPFYSPSSMYLNVGVLNPEQFTIHVEPECKASEVNICWELSISGSNSIEVGSQWQ